MLNDIPIRVVICNAVFFIFKPFYPVVSVRVAKSMALSLPEVDEYLHFDKPAFRVGGKIFSTIHLDKNFMMVKLSQVDQSVYCSFKHSVIFPVPGGWGRNGATFIDLKKINRTLLREILETGWKTVAPLKLLSKYFGEKK